MRKQFTLVLAMLMLANLAACGGGETAETTAADVGTDAPETTSLFEADDLPADLDLDGETIKICVQSTRLSQYFIEESTGDVVNDAIYEARRTVEDRLNAVIEYVPYTYNSWDDRTTYMNQVGASILADSDDFDILGSSSFIANFFLSGYLSDISDAPYIDYDKPWWSKNMAENITVNGVQPFITGDISIGTIKSMMCMYYNKQLHEMYNLPDLYEIVNAGEWTLDKFESLMTDTYADINGNTTVDEEDRLSFVLEGSNYATGFFDAIGMQIYEKSGDSLTFIFDNERNTNAFQRLITVLTSTEGYMRRGSDDSTNYLAEAALFNDGNVLFTGGWISCAESYRDLDFDYGIIPYPKYDDSQKEYRTTVLNTYTNFAIPVTCKRVEASCAVLEALGSEFYRTVTPAYFETALKVKYARDDQTSQMFDLLRENAGYSFGMVFTNAVDLIDTQFKNAIGALDENWASRIAAKKDAAITMTEDIVAMYGEMAK